MQLLYKRNFDCSEVVEMEFGSWASELTSSILPDGICKSIAEEIGADNLLKLAVLVGGSTFYMPKVESILRPLMNQKIREEYNGYNIGELAKKYGVSQRKVYQTIQKK